MEAIHPDAQFRAHTYEAFEAVKAFDFDQCQSKLPAPHDFLFFTEYFDLELMQRSYSVHSL